MPAAHVITDRMRGAWAGLLVALLAVVGLLVAPPAAAGAATAAAQVDEAEVSGPIPATAEPGGPSRDYPFFATHHDIASAGYVEEEFFLVGTASTYSNSGTGTASVESSGHPYRTRLLVRRPEDPRRFNGTVVLEWLNVSNQYDQDGDWMQSHEHLVREGYAWVGVSAQRAGVHSATGLRAWSPDRYGALDLTAGGTFQADELAHDIFSQAARALRDPVGADPLGGLRPELILATGHSQSAAWLTTYYNRVHPLTEVVDGFVLRGGWGQVRTDLETPAWKLFSESDVLLLGQAAARQPDSASLRTWEVTGTSHGDWKLILEHGPVRIRDIGSAPDDYPGTPPSGCTQPPFSRVRAHLVQNAVYDALAAWAGDGIEPPHAEPIELESVQPAVAARDEFGIARGGIRLPEVEVPTATNTGLNSGPGFCFLHGAHIPFDAETLDELYPTHGRYVSRYVKVTKDALRSGFITSADAADSRRQAARSDVGK